MKLEFYKKNINKNIKQINKNINDIENKVLKLKEIQAGILKIDKQ